MRNEKQNDKKNTNIWNKSRLDPVLQALHYGGKWLIPAPNTTIVDRDSYNFVDTGTFGATYGARRRIVSTHRFFMCKKWDGRHHSPVRPCVSMVSLRNRQVLSVMNSIDCKVIKTSMWDNIKLMRLKNLAHGLVWNSFLYCGSFLQGRMLKWTFNTKKCSRNI